MRLARAKNCISVVSPEKHRRPVRMVSAFVRPAPSCFSDVLRPAASLSDYLPAASGPREIEARTSFGIGRLQEVACDVGRVHGQPCVSISLSF